MRFRLLLAAAILPGMAAFPALLVTTPAGAVVLARTLEAVGGSTSLAKLATAQAIALLGGRTARVHSAARLYQQLQLPILVTGKGTGDAPFAAESEKMAQILRDQYGIRPRWVETESMDTTENARFSWCLVGPQGIHTIALVTDPMHMLRARLEFLVAGFDVLPAPTADQPGQPAVAWSDWRSYAPSRAGIAAARHPLKEWAGAAAVLIETAFNGGVRSAPSPGRAPPRSCTPPPGTAARDPGGRSGGEKAAAP